MFFFLLLPSLLLLSSWFLPIPLLFPDGRVMPLLREAHPLSIFLLCILFSSTVFPSYTTSINSANNNNSVLYSPHIFYNNHVLNFSHENLAKEPIIELFVSGYWWWERTCFSIFLCFPVLAHKLLKSRNSLVKVSHVIDILLCLTVISTPYFVCVFSFLGLLEM